MQPRSVAKHKWSKLLSATNCNLVVFIQVQIDRTNEEKLKIVSRCKSFTGRSSRFYSIQMNVTTWTLPIGPGGPGGPLSPGSPYRFRWNETQRMNYYWNCSRLCAKFNLMNLWNVPKADFIPSLAPRLPVRLKFHGKKVYFAFQRE